MSPTISLEQDQLYQVLTILSLQLLPYIKTTWIMVDKLKELKSTDPLMKESGIKKIVGAYNAKIGYAANASVSVSFDAADTALIDMLAKNAANLYGLGTLCTKW